MTPRIYLVAAIAANGVIGAQGRLPWHLPEDLRRFKQITLGHPVVMGRKTWESIGKPLPGRENIVITRRRDYRAPGAVLVASLDEALAHCKDQDRVYVIGGSAVFRAALPIATGLVLTEIHRDYAGDVYWPEIDRTAWREAKRETHVGANGIPFDFVHYERARDA
ncbi:MAG TPA: dihydrofolate reductase [Burkholderiales bacterium]|nr:dihydrofolate reductase [Burkholderiales bacterium]